MGAPCRVQCSDKRLAGRTVFGLLAKDIVPPCKTQLADHRFAAARDNLCQAPVELKHPMVCQPVIRVRIGQRDPVFRAQVVIVQE